MSIKILLSVLIGFSLLSCNNENKEERAVGPRSEPIEEQAVSEETHAGELSLNKGVKWQTDESTRIHAAKLNTAIDGFNAIENPDLAAYHAFAAGMQNELGGLVKDCKMKGADHDALHLWLEPVMKDVAELKKVSTASAGKQTADRLTADVKKFNQYFENAD